MELEVVKQGWHITWNSGLKVKRCFSINILLKYEYVIHSWASLLLLVPYPSCLPPFCSPRSLFPNYSSSLFSSSYSFLVLMNRIIFLFPLVFGIKNLHLAILLQVMLRNIPSILVETLRCSEVVTDPIHILHPCGRDQI